MLRMTFITGRQGFVILPSYLMRRLSLRERVPTGWSKAVFLSDFDFFFDHGFFLELDWCPRRWEATSLRSGRGSVRGWQTERSGGEISES